MGRMGWRRCGGGQPPGCAASVQPCQGADQALIRRMLHACFGATWCRNARYMYSSCAVMSFFEARLLQVRAGPKAQDSALARKQTCGLARP
jgi:hypothetical protein